MAKITKEQFIESLKEMTLLEVKEWVDAMKEEFGVDPTAVAVAGPAQAAAPAEEEGPKNVLSLFSKVVPLSYWPIEL